MAINTLIPEARGPEGYGLAPIHGDVNTSGLRICVFTSLQPETVSGPFLLLRELPGSRVYLGAICDAAAHIHDYVEICVQTLELRDLTFSNHQERLVNYAFDERWRNEFSNHVAQRRDAVIVTGMETTNPSPIIVKRNSDKPNSGLLPVEVCPWQLCCDDAALESFGLPPYTTSPYRYLHQPGSPEAKTFLATAEDAPNNSHVQSTDRLGKSPEALAVFNSHSGLIHITRFKPLSFDDYLQVLEGCAWEGNDAGGIKGFRDGVYSGLQAWSAKPKGMPFLLHGFSVTPESMYEVLFLKLSALRNLFTEVRANIKTHQLPLLNLSPSSFRVALSETGEHFPALWSAQCTLSKPGQAYPLKIKSTEQKYFIRLGRVEPSPFLPEGLGAHSFGIGSVRMRNVTTENDGVVLEGTLVAEDYLGLDPQDLLWFKLPLADTRVEFYAHIYTSETIGPREARFRTVPARLSEPVVASLKRAAGTVFQKSPYEIWPLLSSPCDMYSLGVIAVRTLLANNDSKLPVVLDDVLSLARHLGKDQNEEDDLVSRLKAAVESDPRLLDLISPQSLIRNGMPVAQARAMMQMDLWFDVVALLLRLFPGSGSHSFCRSFGDVSPLALETVFDQPIQELETLVLRLRSVLVPSLSANEEIASVLLEQLAAG